MATTLKQAIEAAKLPREQINTLPMNTQLKVVKVTDSGASLEIEGTLLYDCDGVSAGTAVVVSISDAADYTRCAELIKAGSSSGAGSVLNLDRVTKIGEASFTTKYLTTAISGGKVKGEMNGHQDRKLFSGVATTPIILFANPEPKQGEPKYIISAINGKNLEVGNDAEGNPLTRAFMQEKMNKLADPNKALISTNLFHPDDSQKANQLDDAYQSIVEFLQQNNGVALVRIQSLEEKEVITSIITGKWDGAAKKRVDPLKIVQDLKLKSLFYGINNKDVDDQVKNGSWIMEVIPGKAYNYGPKAKEGLIKAIATMPAESMVSENVQYGADSSGKCGQFSLTVMGDNMLVANPQRIGMEMIAIGHMRTPHYKLANQEAVASNAPVSVPEKKPETLPEQHFDAKPIEDVSTGEIWVVDGDAPDVETKVETKVATTNGVDLTAGQADKLVEQPAPAADGNSPPADMVRPSRLAR